jgi:chemotaxis protein MotB
MYNAILRKIRRIEAMKGPNILYYLIISVLVFAISGCAVGFYKGRPSDTAKIEELKDELSRLKEAKAILESRLKGEIDKKQVKVSMEDRGLVITFVAEVLFDSGKASVKSEGKEILVKIADVVKEESIDNYIGVEGHTDNEPIKYSGWKSNWELSTARATNVLHYLVDECGLNPEKLSATGYGEYRPVASNETADGRQKNRRVEIIIKPQEVTKASRGSEETEDSAYIK